MIRDGRQFSDKLSSEIHISFKVYKGSQKFIKSCKKRKNHNFQTFLITINPNG